MNTKLMGILETLHQEGYDGGDVRENIQRAHDQIIELWKSGKLLKACKEFVAWFDYISAYQHENLAKGFKEACENWSNMTEPSPNVEIMREAITEVEKNKEG